MRLKCCFLGMFLILLISSSISKTNPKKEASSFLQVKTEMKSTTKTATQTKTTTTTKFCNELCMECSENDRNYCTICKTGIYQFDYNCYSKCPDGTYPDTQWQVCRKCDVNCPLCWGPNSDMCGAIPGVRTTVTMIENEIRDFMLTYTFTRDEVVSWTNSLKVLLKDNHSLINQIDNSDTLSPSDIYGSNKVDLELPLGSFSKLDGVFIPVPAYIDKNGELIQSHWVFKKGMWDGNAWNDQWFPRVNSFIKLKGSQNKIYYENGGYWVYEQHREWYWIKSHNIVETVTDVASILSQLNTIKIDVKISLNKLGDFETRRLKHNLQMNRVGIENNIRLFFNKFEETNKLIFSQLKDTINNEQANLITSLDNLKNKVRLYFGEESIMKENQSHQNIYPTNEGNVNFRRSGKMNSNSVSHFKHSK